MNIRPTFSSVLIPCPHDSKRNFEFTVSKSYEREEDIIKMESPLDYMSHEDRASVAPETNSGVRQEILIVQLGWPLNE